MVIENFTSSPHMVSWYILDIGIILISLRIKEFFSLRDIGSTYVTVIEWFGQLVELSMLISSSRQFLIQSCNFFYREYEYCCLAVCLVKRLSRFYLGTDVISVRLELKFLCQLFQTSLHGWAVWQLILLLRQFCITWLCLLFYLLWNLDRYSR